MCQYLAGIRNQLLQQGKFRWGQSYLFSSTTNYPPLQINFQVAIAAYPWRGRLRKPLLAPKHCPDARQQLLHTKGLCQIVIGPQIKRAHLVPLIIKRREDNDRYNGGFPYPAAYLQTVHTRHHNIQDKQLRLLCFPERKRFDPIARFQHSKITGAEIATDESAQVQLVFSDKNTFGWHSHLPSLGSADLTRARRLAQASRPGKLRPLNLMELTAAGAPRRSLPRERR